ncbi:MAG: HupE/UreJ family protein [Cyanobacteria bacterium J06649_4]
MFNRFLHNRFLSTRTLSTKAALAFVTCCLCILSAAVLPGNLLPSASAHQTHQSYLFFQIGESEITARVELPMNDINDVLSLGLASGKRITPAQMEPFIPQIEAYAAQHTQVACPPQTCELSFTGHEYFNEYQSQFVNLLYDLQEFEELPTELSVSFDPLLAEKPGNTNLLLIDENWKTGTFGDETNVLLVFDQPGQEKSLSLGSGSLLQGFWGVVKLGVEHILEGVDHVLFLVALLLPSVLRRKDSNHWQPVGSFSTAFVYILKVATAFTIAHSITLCLATLQIVQVPSRIVESVIAASIGLAAVEIFYPIFRGRAWLIIFLFGLFHGFGFADVLADLGVTSQYAALSLFGFNLGVELGQIAIIAVIFPLLYLFRRQRFYPKVVLRTGGLLLGLMSLYWFIERAFDVNLQVMPFFQGLV